MLTWIQIVVNIFFVTLFIIILLLTSRHFALIDPDGFARGEYCVIGIMILFSTLGLFYFITIIIFSICAHILKAINKKYYKIFNSNAFKLILWKHHFNNNGR
jgi:hypothetical protein